MQLAALLAQVAQLPLHVAQVPLAVLGYDPSGHSDTHVLPSRNLPVGQLVQVAAVLPKHVEQAALHVKQTVPFE